MRTAIRYISIFLTACALSSCVKEDGITMPGRTETEVSVQLIVDTPQSAAAATRAVAENDISQIDVLVLEKPQGASVYHYAYTVQGLSLSQASAGRYRFSARILANRNPVKLYIMANGRSDLSPGITESDLQAVITREYTAAGIDGHLPMFGMVDLPAGITEDSQFGCSLLRSVARADILSSADNFQLLSAQFYRANNLMSLIPLETAVSVVTVPSVPPTASASVNTVPINISGNRTEADLYVTESIRTSPTERRTRATCLVVGGRFGGPDEPVTYYRMDFVPDQNAELSGQILRNHKYVFRIKEVSGPGWPTPDDAAHNESTNITVEIKEWNESTHDMVFDGTNHFGVSSRDVKLNFMSGSEKKVDVDTSLDSYTLQWTDSSGNVIVSIPSIGKGESFVDTDGLFTVSISSDGETITIRSNTTNGYTDKRVCHLLAVAGRLRLSMTITQNTPIVRDDFIYVYGQLGNIGQLGNEILGAAAAPDRPKAMVDIMRSLSNYGPTGLIPFKGYRIGGQSGNNSLTEFQANLFDVIYLPYLSNPSTETSDLILTWLAEDDRRILIVHHDDNNTNPNLLSRLGVTRNTINNTSAFMLSPEAPPLFTDGPFGKVNSSMQFRCYDTTHGEIPLSAARNKNITPILLGGPNGTGGVVFGIDFDRRIVYSGDIDLYYSSQGAQSGSKLSGGGEISTDADRFIANFWTWVAEVVLGY